MIGNRPNDKYQLSADGKLHWVEDEIDALDVIAYNRWLRTEAIKNAEIDSEERKRDLMDLYFKELNKK